MSNKVRSKRLDECENTIQKKENKRLFDSMTKEFRFHNSSYTGNPKILAGELFCICLMYPEHDVQLCKPETPNNEIEKAFENGIVLIRVLSEWDFNQKQYHEIPEDEWDKHMTNRSYYALEDLNVLMRWHRAYR